MSDHPTHRPTAATWAGALLLLEAIGMLALAVWATFSALGEAPEHIAGGLFLAALAAGSAFFLLQAGRAMLDGEGPVWLALILAGLAIATLVLALRKSVTGWLRREE